jgi:hypothetical protein
VIVLTLANLYCLEWKKQVGNSLRLLYYFLEVILSNTSVRISKQLVLVCVGKFCVHQV